MKNNDMEKYTKQINNPQILYFYYFPFFKGFTD